MPRHVDASCDFILFSPNEKRVCVVGGDAARLFILFFFSLFSRPQVGLATELSSFFVSATIVLFVEDVENLYRS